MSANRPRSDGSRGTPPPPVPAPAPNTAPPLPELLAPAGNWDCARAAVENGADAIYFGLDRFNARMRAANFSEADLPALMEYLHRRGVRGYLSLNTLVFTEELREAEGFLRAAIGTGVDAAIVQDVGVCRLVRRISADFPIHASTQMTISSGAGVALARELGCRRVVLARECTLEDIAKIQAEALGSPDAGTANTAAALDLEVFVHGALCVAYSGQCLTSEALGGRSANRGECAQACRLPYELFVDGRKVPLGDRRYLLSPQDLAGIDLLPQLVRLGVRSLKIEGRLKSPEYVANITRLYREALDALNRAGAGKPRAGNDAKAVPGPDRRYEMEMAFSRGLATGWLGGIDNQALVHGRFGTKRGVYLGRVRRVEKDRVALLLEGPLKPGDGVVFDAGHPEESEQGGRVYDIELRGAESWIGFGRGDIDFRKVHVGDRLWKTSDPELDRRLRQTYAPGPPRFRRPIEFEVQGRAGSTLTLAARDELGHEVRVESDMVLAHAARQPLDAERLAEQLGRLGASPFRLAAIHNRLEGDVILPVRELNRMRRVAATGLEQRRAQPTRWNLQPPQDPSPIQRDATPRRIEGQPAGSTLIVLVRSADQLEAALDLGIETVYCEFEDLKQYRDAVARFHARRGPGTAPSGIYVVPPRITKPGEDWMLRLVRSSEADGYLVRNADQLAFFRGCRCVGDYTLNVANPLAVEYFLERFALERVTAAYDLNDRQLESLVPGVNASRLEVVVHQHMPMFHMEHCVFCAFLTPAKNHTRCGRPCDRHQLRLRDRMGADHPVRVDAGCRNTVYHAAAQTGAGYVGRLQALGVRHFRIEFLDEPPAVVSQAISSYRQLLRGEITGEQLWRGLRLRHQLGVTRGALDKGERPITVL